MLRDDSVRIYCIYHTSMRTLLYALQIARFQSIIDAGLNPRLLDQFFKLDPFQRNPKIHRFECLAKDLVDCLCL